MIQKYPDSFTSIVAGFMFWNISKEEFCFMTVTSFFGHLLTESFFLFFFLNMKGPNMLIHLFKEVLSLLKKNPLQISFFHKKLCLPELESSGRARRPRGWASGQWAHRF